MLAGVCGGIAEYFGIDATVVRLLWTMLSLLTMWPGIVAYILAWIIVPGIPGISLLPSISCDLFRQYYGTDGDKAWAHP